MDNFKSSGLTRKINNIVARARQETREEIIKSLAVVIYEISDELEEQEEIQGEYLHFEVTAGGFTEEQINLFYKLSHSTSVMDWLASGADGMLDELIIRFMNFRQMNRSGLLKHFPCTFQKWTEQDEEDLRTVWTRTDPEKVNWADLEEMFGRPRNAIKIRLEKLGFSLAEPAARKY